MLETHCDASAYEPVAEIGLQQMMPRRRRTEIGRKSQEGAVRNGCSSRPWTLCSFHDVRSRDNLPNPQQDSAGYVLSNSPAIGDLMDMFDFTSHN